MSCKYNNCKHCGYKSECEIFKENAELKKEVDLWKKASENNSFKAFQFEKENKELKAKNKWYSEQVCNKECAEVWGELDKAKEIIRELFHYIPSWAGEGNDKPRVYAMPDELRAKAEQFIKDSEVK